MKKLLMAVIGVVALAGAAIAEEVNLKTLAAKDGSGNIVYYSDGGVIWASGREADKAFDGDTSTYYDPKWASCDTYAGYGLSRPCVLTRIRYYPRNESYTIARLGRSVIQGANESDFSDAVDIYSFSGKVPADLITNLRWLEVVPDVAAPFSYFRILEKWNGESYTFAGNTAELEFYGMEAGNLQQDLSVVRGDYPEVANVLNWSPAFGETTILRAFGPGGPWTEVARFNGVNTWSDTTAPGGSVCYYRAITEFTYGGESISLTNKTAVAAPRRWRLLERDPSDMTHLRSGVNLIYTCGTTTPLCWINGAGKNTYADVTNSLMIAFNNVLWKDYNDGGNVNSSAGILYCYDCVDTQYSNPTCMGVDLGEGAHFAFLRLYPCYYAHCNGIVASGSNNANWSNRSNFTILTEETSGIVHADPSSVKWFEFESFDSETAYRYLFCYNSYNGWQNRLSELQFYGWLESEVAGLAAGTTDLSLTCGTSPSVTLTWAPVQYGSTYKIERKTGDGAWEAVASALPIATTTWTDTSVVCNGTRYTYRVTTVNGANEAYSEEVEIRPYVAGNGIGLHGEWWTNYGIATGGETLALVTTNATVDVANANVGGATENIFVRWSGKLIAPYAGDFTFEADADGLVCLWIDGSPVLHKTATSANLALTAGEHDVTVTWLHGSGTGNCSLLLGGAVPRNVIPSTQLVPVAPQALPDGWTSARLFARSDSATCVGDVHVNGDGTIDFAYGGEDLSYSYNGYNFMWQTVTGDFTLKAVIQSTPANNRWAGPKAGLMVRNSLDATSMMSAYGVKRLYEYLVLVGRQRTSAAPGGIYPQTTVNGIAEGNIYYVSETAYVKLQRVGNTFSFFYKESASAPWTKLYEYEDTNGEYGETVYVGPAAFGNDAGGGDLDVPYYRWRFSDVKLSAPTGTVLVIR